MDLNRICILIKGSLKNSTHHAAVKKSRCVMMFLHYTTIA